MNVRLRDIADKLGLSHTTVSRVLNNRPNTSVSAQTRERIIFTANEMGYSSNKISRALVTGSSNLIALWAYCIHKAYYISVIQSIRELVIPLGYQTLLVETRNDPSKKPEPWNYWWPVDAVLAFDSPLCVESWVKTGNIRKAPMVSVGMGYSTLLDYVGFDLYSGAEEAVKHLVARGCRRIVYLSASVSLHPGEARYDAYLRVMQESGLQPEFIEITGEYTANERPVARRKIKDYIQLHGKPEAVFCYNDEAAIAVYRGLKDIGLRVPDDLLLVGCDGIEDGQYLDAPLSTIVYPIDQVARVAWDFLSRRMKDSSLPKQEKIFKARFEVRASSGGTFSGIQKK
jgi:LacI family transcriptional regulator